ncbi:uncharacterized protein I303_101612 [Kwoniella dejecticola CBS 10117]|uniref:Uncharacterized protein n=1 Tax=Kwoniella dejecticola CBS 10117 TaxID=1296121 RepID=A0A1A6ADA3_9TREE|nr:uncharacterized protein I303_02253 [Kwoniella dejecticola CBS 10117]OBR88035.1 hypothetical protein I303_02253 [Kwoniella dejecticola CBS 10117]
MQHRIQALQRQLGYVEAKHCSSTDITPLSGSSINRSYAPTLEQEENDWAIGQMETGDHSFAGYFEDTDRSSPNMNGKVYLRTTIEARMWGEEAAESSDQDIDFEQLMVREYEQHEEHRQLEIETLINDRWDEENYGYTCIIEDAFGCPEDGCAPEFSDYSDPEDDDMDGHGYPMLTKWRKA